MSTERPASSRSTLVRAATNSGWLFADRFLRLAVGLTLGVLIARALGPRDYGSLSYATAFVALFSTLATLGLDAVVVRELALDPTRKHVVLGTVLALKLVAGCLAYSVVLSAALLMPSSDSETLRLVAIMGCALVLQTTDAFDFWFQSQVQARYVVTARLLAFGLISALKICLLWWGAHVTAFAWAAIVEVVLAGLGLLAAFGVTGNALTSLRIDRALARSLLHKSWPLALSGMFVLLTMQLDKILLDLFAGRDAVGIYSVAGQFSTVWYMVPMIVGASVAPGLARAYAEGSAGYERNLRVIYTVMTWLAIAAAAVTSACSDWLVSQLFGARFTSAAPVLAIHIWGGVFVFHVSIRTRALVAEDKQRYVTAIAALTLATSLGLNCLLIAPYGVLGAAWSSLIAWAMCATVFPAIWPETRKSAVMFLTPFRL